MTDLLVGWKSGSGGEHHYATIFCKIHMKTDMDFDFSMNTLEWLVLYSELIIIRIMQK